MFELTQSLGLDLTYSFTSDLELLPDFFQSVLVAVSQSEPHLEDLGLSFGQRFQVLFACLLAITD